MSLLNRRHSPLCRQLQAYEESWKLDYVAAQDCFDWEELIAVGTTVGELLERATRQWREAVFRGTESFDPQTEGMFLAAHRIWVAVTDAILHRASTLEQRFGVVAGLPELRAARERIQGACEGWKAPHLAAAVGTRDQQLTGDDAAALDALLARPAPPLPARRLDEKKSSFLQ